jgi:acyl-CoA reductase-like NAD-dependent aldehyde dehydrogenase
MKSEKYDMWIGGEWVQSESGKTIPSINPATGEEFARFPAGVAADVDKAVRAARGCFESDEWQGLTYKDRGEFLREAGRLIMEQAVELSALETKDNGKPIKESSLIDIPTASETFKTFASMVVELRGETLPHTGGQFSYTVYGPRGVIGQIIPWNYPLLMAAWKIAPALAAGNAVVLKPSELTSLAALELGKILEKAGLPSGAVNIVTGTGREAGAPLAEHRGIDKVAFTGSTETGKSIIAGSAAGVTPVTAELGGKSPAIVFGDCNIEKTAGSILSSIFLNQGQMCVANSRLLAEKNIYDEMLDILKSRADAITVGNGMEPTTDMGPLVSAEHRDQVAGFVRRAVEAGAVLECGGECTDEYLSGGFFYRPTILSGVTPDMEIWKEEVFGPVLVTSPFETEKEALHLANDTRYGLAASVWTRDNYRTQRMINGLNAGTVWVNTFGSFSDEVPFGGFGASGYGKELGREGLLANCRLKSVTMDVSPDETPLVEKWYGD